MSNISLGVDCCSDRYEVYTSMRCECGCSRCYCIACYEYHCVRLVEQLIKQNILPLKKHDI